MKLLIVGHDASRTGAPRFLLNFIQWLRSNTDCEVEVILGNRGPLLDSYRAICSVTLWRDVTGVRSFVHRGVRKVFKVDVSKRRVKHFVDTLTKKRFDVIFCNTSVNGLILEQLQVLSLPVITRVPELQHVMKSYFSDVSRIDKTFQYSSEIIAVSRAVKAFVQERYAITDDRIHVCYGRVPRVDQTRFDRPGMRRELNLPDSAVIIGACGGFEWRKGPDIFLAVANIIVHQMGITDVRFVWVGGPIPSVEYEQLEFEMEKCNLIEYVTFTGSVEAPLNYMNGFDVFLMTSREDPFPLVNLEAAHFGIPVLGFDDTGGTPELLQMAEIEPVRYGDINRMAERLATLIHYPEIRVATGRKLQQVAEERFDFEEGSRTIFGILERMSSKRMAQAVHGL